MVSGGFISPESVYDALSVTLRKTILVEVFDSLPSTNNYLKELAEDSAQAFQTCIAREQTAGKGRRGKQFYSPRDTGLYMSVLLPWNNPARGVNHITALAALAVCQTLESCCEGTIGIKWFNDIYLNDRKVCGILCETTQTAGQTNAYVVVGMGINIYEPKNGYPDELKDKVTSVSQSCENPRVAEMAAHILERLYALIHTPGNTIINLYRRRSILDGRAIHILKPGEEALAAQAIGINADLSLAYQLHTGEIKHLSAGDVSVSLDS